MEVPAPKSALTVTPHRYRMKSKVETFVTYYTYHWTSLRARPRRRRILKFNCIMLCGASAWPTIISHSYCQLRFLPCFSRSVSVERRFCFRYATVDAAIMDSISVSRFAGSVVRLRRHDLGNGVHGGGFIYEIRRFVWRMKNWKMRIFTVPRTASRAHRSGMNINRPHSGTLARTRN